MSVTKEITIQKQIKEITVELLNAAEHLKDLSAPAVSIFGSARTPVNSLYYNKTIEISKLLVKAGFSIISGGGPGIMEAANKGCFEANGASIGLNIKLPHEQHDNPFQSYSVDFKYFVSRKTTFFMKSNAYVVMPGGFGTMDEFFETVTLLQTNKLHKTPVVLVGSKFWTGLIHWIQEQLLENHYIATKDLQLFQIEDDPVKVVDYVKSQYEQYKQQQNGLALR